MSGQTKARHIRNKSRKIIDLMRNQDRRASRIAKRARQHMIEQARLFDLLKMHHEALLDRYQEQ